MFTFIIKLFTFSCMYLIAPTTALNHAEPFPIGIQSPSGGYLKRIYCLFSLRYLCSRGRYAGTRQDISLVNTVLAIGVGPWIIAPEGKIEAIINVVEIFVCLCLSCNYIRLRQVRSGRRGPFLFCL